MTRLHKFNAIHLFPIGSVWETWQQAPGEHSISDGLIRVDRITDYAVHFTYDSSHKNSYYQSFTMGRLSDWHVSASGNKIIREKDGHVSYYTRIADCSRWDSYKPLRLPVCKRWACDIKQGPIADGFPANYK